MASTQQQGVVAALPFTASAHEHTEPAFTSTVTPSTTVQQLNPIDVPAYGYLRSIFLEISSTGGVGGTGNADFPFNILSQVTLQDVNGANIVGPLDGYALYIANLLGGYSGNFNPVNAPWYVGTAPNPVFFLRIPVEVDHSDGLGALSNQNAAANYKLSIAINTIAATTSVAYTTPPTITIRGWLEAWTLPAPMDNRGRPQAQVPPLLGTGQYWSSSTRTVLVGSNTLPVTRVGNLIRTLVFIARDGTAARVNTVFPDPALLNWDGMQIHNASQRYLQQYLYEKILGAVTLPTGVFALPFSAFGAAGVLGQDNGGAGWLPTTQSTRLELTGTSAVAGSIQFLVNEVAPVEVNQAERFQSPSDSGLQAGQPAVQA